MPHGHTQAEWDALRQRTLQINQRASFHRVVSEMSPERFALECSSPLVLTFIEALIEKVEELNGKL